MVKAVAVAVVVKAVAEAEATLAAKAAVEVARVEAVVVKAMARPVVGPARRVIRLEVGAGMLHQNSCRGTAGP